MYTKAELKKELIKAIDNYPKEVIDNAVFILEHDGNCNQVFSGNFHTIKGMIDMFSLRMSVKMQAIYQKDEETS